VMYIPSEDHVLALDAATGKEIWTYEVATSPAGALSRRGVTYWTGESTIPARIFVTAGSRLTAINAATGEAVQSFGKSRMNCRRERGIHPGRLNMGGSIATAGGLTFIGATNDRCFRAIDAKTGKERCATKLSNSAISVPMTYQVRGKQYVAITASGSSVTDPD